MELIPNSNIKSISRGCVTVNYRFGFREQNVSDYLRLCEKIKRPACNSGRLEKTVLGAIPLLVFHGQI